MKRKPLFAVIFAVAAAGAASGTWLVARKPSSVAVQPQGPLPAVAPIASGMNDMLAAYRKMIVLTADDAGQTATERAAANHVGQLIFHENQERIARVDGALDKLIGSNDPRRYEALDSLLDFVESSEGMYDADRLAFRELMQSMQDRVAKDSSLPAIKMHKRISDDIDALAEIERNYDKEIRAVFGRFESRSIELKREKWTSYVAYLKTLYQRERILKDYGVVTPYPAKPEPAETPDAGSPPPLAKDAKEEYEIFGKTLPKKTVVLTFDDGPHRRYSEEIAAILKQYDAPAVFFNVGRNLGTLDAHGAAKLNPGAEVSRKLMAEGYVIGNHSFSHAQLSKESGDALKAEIFNTDLLLKAVDAHRSSLFRFPYGARN